MAVGHFDGVEFTNQLLLESRSYPLTSPRGVHDIEAIAHVIVIHNAPWFEFGI